MRANFLVLGVAAALSASGWSHAGEASALLQAHLEVAALESHVGPAHPKRAAASATIERLESAGVRIELQGAEREFARLFEERQKQLQRFGSRHSTVVSLSRKLSRLASLLADELH